MKNFLLLSPLIVVSFLTAANQIPPKTPYFPQHLDQCIDGYLYRVFLDERNQIIPSSIHQVMEKSSLHQKLLPKQCKEKRESK
ncbi:hypothetical protein BKH41_06950 [Helicobacter sp. 12S02232-10]|uniref:hypothetical protein n=1 Tax=Helicobacter sp. 12S02232-10 TaxID=1476197 RepID=UPI000BA673BB|nr:hypothetical protein [Helicobacter sp. 12S02232-10]PAF47628.1 hypothetical protein BKH41_06950 [Helicobacter sp. 12S02232-10]